MKRAGKRMVAVLCIVMMLLPVSARADVALTGDYNWQDASFDLIINEDAPADLMYGPGLEYGRIEEIPAGTRLHVFMTAENMFDECSWGEVEYGLTFGWVDLSKGTRIESNKIVEASWFGQLIYFFLALFQQK